MILPSSSFDNLDDESLRFPHDSDDESLRYAGFFLFRVFCV